jgi:hypothetical protein
MTDVSSTTEPFGRCGGTPAGPGDGVIARLGLMPLPRSHLEDTISGTLKGTSMRIFAYDRFKPGVSLETIEPYLPEEVANVWRLWKAGIVRENYARADEPGVAIVFELESVEDAKRYTDDFPLTKAGFLEWFFIPLTIPLPIESLFRGDVDTSEPYDRTTTIAN